MFRRPNNVSCRYALSKGTGKTNTRQYNLKFKNRSYFMVTLTCCKGIKVFFPDFSCTHRRSCVYAWTLRPWNRLARLKQVKETYMLFAGWEVRMVKNCDRGLENAVTIRTDLSRQKKGVIFFLQ